MTRINRFRKTAKEDYQLKIATIFNAKDVNFSNLFLGKRQIAQYEDALEQVLYLSQMYNLRNISTGEVRFESVKHDYGIVIAKENANQDIDAINFGDKPLKAFSSGNFSQRVRPSAVNKIIVTHEFAHVLTDSVRNKVEAVSAAYWRELDKIWKAYEEQGPQLYQYNRHISIYSFCNIDEFHAEAFVEYHLSDTPSPEAVQVGQLIDKHFKNDIVDIN